MVEKMNEKEFYETLYNEVKKSLSKDDANNLVMEHRENSTKEFEGLYIKSKGMIVCLNDIYDKYKNGEDFENLVDKVCNTIYSPPTWAKNLEWVKNYEQVRKHLFIRLQSKNVIKNIDCIPHDFLTDDIIATYRIMCYSEEPHVVSFIVKNEFLTKMWGISVEQFKDDAIKNCMNMCPTKLSTYNNKELPFVLNRNAILVSNKQMINGAATLCYPGLLDSLTDKLGGTIAIIPSSIHEVIVQKFDECKVDENNIAVVNHTYHRPEDILSDHLYVYDPNYKKLESKDHYLRRKYKA